MIGLFDSFQRRISYLRISVTDRCNLRCIYCMPPEGVTLIAHGDLLSYEEIRTVVRAAAGLGINEVRLTGGEPLIRAELPILVRMLSQIEGIEEISLTTNGTLLKEYALELKQAGLKRVNVSLDTLKADRFRYITRFGEVADVLAGIEAAMVNGLRPVKINMVVMRDINDDEVLDFANMTHEEGWHVRFIELMPFTDMTRLVPSSELRQRIELLGALKPCPSVAGKGPARYFRLPGASGTIGFISPMTEPFCSSCNRLRLTSCGRLCPCLLSDDGIDLKQPLRSNASVQEIERLVLEAVGSKLEHHCLSDSAVVVRRRMHQIGG
jgi:cyclic pyranopterin phosphate synthase